MKPWNLKTHIPFVVNKQKLFSFQGTGVTLRSRAAQIPWVVFAGTAAACFKAPPRCSHGVISLTTSGSKDSVQYSKSKVRWKSNRRPEGLASRLIHTLTNLLIGRALAFWEWYGLIEEAVIQLIPIQAHGFTYHGPRCPPKKRKKHPNQT